MLRRRPRAHPLHPLLPVALASLLVAACAAPGPLADPREILGRSVEAVAAARSFHYVATLAGEVPLPAVGAAEAAPLDLAGTTLEGRVDVAGGNGTATMAIPGLGPAFDAVVVGPDLYLRVGLLGDGYRRTGAAGNPLALLADPAAILRILDGSLASLPEPPRKEPDRDCGGGRCYVVVIAVPAGSAADLPGTLGGLIGSGLGAGLDPGLGAGLDPGLGSAGDLPFPDLTAGALPDLTAATRAGGTAELLVRIDDLRPYSIAIRAADPDAPSMTIAFDDWDEPVRVEPPAGAG